MVRLTEWDEYGNADIIALSDVMPELYSGMSFDETNALTDAINRLAEYEDTGLTPLEVASFAHVNRGRWIMRGGYFRCSECDAKSLLRNAGGTGGYREYDQVQSKYCPNCGAKMDGGETV